MPIKIPVTQTGLEASIEAAAKKAGKSLKVNMGPGAKSIEGLSQPLGRITGKADQFTKSMEAANARVLAFGASVGVLSAVTRGFKSLVTTTIEVEKSLININSILGTTTAQLNTFKKEIFDVARNTEQSFETVAQAALELSRQGLKAEEVTTRLNDALILSRLSGLGASEAVFGLTAAINSFNATGITSTEVLNKLSAAAVSAAVSERDLIEGVKRSGSVAIQAGVSFDELIGVITAVQARTARGGAVIGNSFKTIFTRIQSLDKLKTMQNLGVEVTDASGQVLSATKLIQNLGKTLADLPDAKRLQIAEGLVGKFQIAPFLAILEDYNRETSVAIKVTEVAANATNEAYSRNVALNEALSAAINQATVNLKELANTLGEIGVTDSLKNILGFFNSLVVNLRDLLEGEGMGSDFAKGLIKGISGVLSGPGLAIAGAIIAKLTIDLVRFGTGSLKTFFGLNMAAKEQATLQGQIASSLLNNKGIHDQILAIERSSLSAEEKKVLQTKFFTTALNEQLAVMQRMQMIAGRVAPGVMAGTRSGRGAFGRGAGGYIPNFNATMGYGSERGDINRGVGGAPSSARPVTIPNFNFGGGQRGTMVANNSEYMVPNFAGSGGSAIFNQNMVSSMGLPAGARKVGAAGGYIPNFAKKPTVRNVDFAGMIIPRKGWGKASAQATIGDNTYKFPVYGIDAAGEKVREEQDIKKSVEKYAINLATREAKTMTGGKPPAGKISKLGNQGAIGSLAGSIFETALGALLKSKDFDFGETATFDFVGTNAVRQIGDISPLLKSSPVRFLEAKIGSNSRTNLSMAKKIQRYFGATASGAKMTTKGRTELLGAGGGKNKFVSSMGHTKKLTGMDAVRHRAGMNFGSRGASGYIPNFAGDLQNAIGREAAAGLPINQIRINQDSSLKNAGNPMGLAVTNMRDEPTGAIPNFASTMSIGGGKSVPITNPGLQKQLDKLAKSTNKVTKGQRDLLGPIFAAQIAMSAMSGATSDATSGMGLFMKRLSGGMSGLTTAAFAGVALKSFGDSMTNAQGKVGGFGKTLGKVGMIGAAIGGSIAMLSAFQKMGEDASGITNENSLALARMTDAVNKASISLATLSEVKKVEIQNALREAFGGDSGTTMEVMMALGGFFNPKRLFGANKGFDEGKLFTQAEVMNQAKDTVGVTQSQQKTIEDLSKQAIAALIQNEGIDILEAIKRVEVIVREEAGKSLAAGTPDSDATGNEGGGGVQTGALIANQLEVAAIQDRLIKIFTGQNKEAAAAVKLELAKKKAAEDLLKIKKEDDRIASSAANEMIRMAAARAKMNDLSIHNAKNELELQRIREGLSERDLINAQTKIKILEEEQTNSEKTLASVRAMVKLTGELTTKTANVTDLKNLMTEASKDGVISEKEEKSILEATNKVLEENTSEKADQINALKNDIILSRENLAIAKEKLETERKTTVEKIDQSLLRDIQDTSVDRLRGLDSRKVLDPLLRDKEEIEARVSGRGLGLQDNFSLQRIEKENAIDAKLLAEVNAQITRREGFESERNKVEEGVASAFEKFGILKDGETGRDKARGMIGGIETQEELDVWLQNNLKKGIGELLGKGGGGNIMPELQESIISDRKTREDGIKATLDQTEATFQNTAAMKGLPDASFLLRNQAKALQDARAGDLLNAQLSTDAGTRIKGGMRDKNFQQRFDLMKAGDIAGLRNLNEAEEFAGTLVDSSIQFAKNIGDAMVMAIARGESLGDSLRSAASDFFLGLSKAFMNRAINNIAGVGTQGGGTGIIGGIANFLTGGMNSGGVVKGGSGHRDDVPTMLTGGEFVMRKGAVSRYGSDFMKSLNEGSIQTMQRGGLFRPGTYGQGAITGKKDLFNYATQGFTTGQHDRVMSGSNVGSVNLEPHSVRMTRWGIRNSRMAQTESAAQQEALGLYFQQLDKEQQEKEQAKAQKDAMKAAFISMVASAALSGATGGFGKGNNTGTGGGQSLWSRIFSGGGGQSTDIYGDPGVLPPKYGFGSIQRATGGSIPYAAGIDTVPTMLSGGEFVMNASATQNIGRGNLASMNSGGGGRGNRDVVGKLDELIDVSEGSGETVINITVNSDGTTTEDSSNAEEKQQSLAMKIKDQVRQVIDEEKRLGGSLRQVRA